MHDNEEAEPTYCSTVMKYPGGIKNAYVCPYLLKKRNEKKKPTKLPTGFWPFDASKKMPLRFNPSHTNVCVGMYTYVYLTAKIVNLALHYLLLFHILVKLIMLMLVITH